VWRCLKLEFGRERLGIWDEGRHSQVIDPTLWQSLRDPDSQLGAQVAFAVDVTPDRKRCSISAAGLRSDGFMHVEVIDNRPGTDWAVDALVELRQSWRPIAIALDKSSPANSLIPALEKAGVAWSDCSGQQMTQACGGFFDDATEKRLRHLGQAHLSSALGAARQRPVGDAWAWHRRDLTDISPLVSVTIARHAYLTADKPAPFLPRRVR
jgi:hypothetical protein